MYSAGSITAGRFSGSATTASTAVLGDCCRCQARGFRLGGDRQVDVVDRRPVRRIRRAFDRGVDALAKLRAVDLGLRCHRQPSLVRVAVQPRGFQRPRVPRLALQRSRYLHRARHVRVRRRPSRGDRQSFHRATAAGSMAADSEMRRTRSRVTATRCAGARERQFLHCDPSRAQTVIGVRDRRLAFLAEFLIAGIDLSVQIGSAAVTSSDGYVQLLLSIREKLIGRSGFGSRTRHAGDASLRAGRGGVVFAACDHQSLVAMGAGYVDSCDRARHAHCASAANCSMPARPPAPSRHCGWPVAGDDGRSSRKVLQERRTHPRSRPNRPTATAPRLATPPVSAPARLRSPADRTHQQGKYQRERRDRRHRVGEPHLTARVVTSHVNVAFRITTTPATACADRSWRSSQFATLAAADPGEPRPRPRSRGRAASVTW